MTLAISDGKYLCEVKDFMNPIRALVKPASEAYFAGVLDIKKIPLMNYRAKFRISVLTGVWKEGDHRDWDAIRTWGLECNSLSELMNEVMYEINNCLLSRSSEK